MGDVTNRCIWAVSAYALVFNIVTLAALVVLWPVANAGSSITGRLWSEETRLLLIATVGGALGASLHVLASLVAYVGNRTFQSSWTLWYVVRPFIGMTAGCLLYIIIRGGILKPTANIDMLNPYAVAGIAAVAGLLSKQLLDKLQAYADRQINRETRSRVAEAQEQKQKT